MDGQEDDRRGETTSCCSLSNGSQTSTSILPVPVPTTGAGGRTGTGSQGRLPQGRRRRDHHRQRRVLRLHCHRRARLHVPRHRNLREDSAPPAEPRPPPPRAGPRHRVLADVPAATAVGILRDPFGARNLQVPKYFLRERSVGPHAWPCFPNLHSSSCANCGRGKSCSCTRCRGLNHNLTLHSATCNRRERERAEKKNKARKENICSQLVSEDKHQSRNLEGAAVAIAETSVPGTLFRLRDSLFVPHMATRRRTRLLAPLWNEQERDRQSERDRVAKTHEEHQQVMEI